MLFESTCMYITHIHTHLYILQIFTVRISTTRFDHAKKCSTETWNRKRVDSKRMHIYVHCISMHTCWLASQWAINCLLMCSSQYVSKSTSAPFKVYSVDVEYFQQTKYWNGYFSNKWTSKTSFLALSFEPVEFCWNEILNQ